MADTGMSAAVVVLTVTGMSAIGLQVEVDLAVDAPDDLAVDAQGDALEVIPGVTWTGMSAAVEV